MVARPLDGAEHGLRVVFRVFQPAADIGPSGLVLDAKLTEDRDPFTEKLVLGIGVDRRRVSGRSFSFGTLFR